MASPATCTAGAPSGTSATFDCTLNGEVNPEGVRGNRSAVRMGQHRSPRRRRPPGSRSARGGSRRCSRADRRRAAERNALLPLAGYDHNVQAPEQLTSERTSFTAPTVAPRVVGAPSASFVTSSSAVLLRRAEPREREHRYAFRYGHAREDDPEVSQSPCPRKRRSRNPRRTGRSA